MLPTAVRSAALAGLLFAAGSHAEPIRFMSVLSDLKNGPERESPFDWKVNPLLGDGKAQRSANHFYQGFRDWRDGKDAPLPGYHGSYGSLESLVGWGFGQTGKGEGLSCLRDEPLLTNGDRRGRGNNPGEAPIGDQTPAVPEPTTALLFAGGLLGIFAFTRRKA